MRIKISHSFLKGDITVPASKSCFQRACACALMRKGESHIYLGGEGEDEKSALNIIKLLGASIYQEKLTYKIRSEGIRTTSEIIDCGESGLSARLFSVLVSVLPDELSFKARGTLINRGFSNVRNILTDLEVKVKSADGQWPLVIQGPMHVRDLIVDASQSSQSVSGLIMAYSYLVAKNKRIELLNPVSLPYIELTLQIMQKFKLKTPIWRDQHSLWFDDNVNSSSSDVIEYYTEADWSSAAMFCVAGALHGDITLKGLHAGSAQADRRILDALKLSGVNFFWEGESLKIMQCKNISAFTFDANHSPDLFPPLVCLAAYATGVTTISGVHRLIHKESNRAESLKEEFSKLGIEIVIEKDLMHIKGGELKQSRVTAHQDHRIAMAMTVACLGIQGETELEEAESVRKSYPDFYKDLITLGAKIQILQDE